MSKLEDIFTANRAINDIKEICSHYEQCSDCPLNDTGVCYDTFPTMWNTLPMFKEERKEVSNA